MLERGLLGLHDQARGLEVLKRNDFAELGHDGRKRMNFKTEFTKLLKKLSEDPKLREAISMIGKNSDKNFAALTQGIATTLLLAGRFVGKARMRKVTNIIDAAVFLISLSLLIKQNVFDRPEVRAFFKRVWGDVSKTAAHLSQVARDYVEKRLAMARR